MIRSQAVLRASGINWDGRRSVRAVERANRESRSSWRDLVLELRRRGLSGVEFVVSHDHAGLRQAIVEVLPEAAWQRCYVHFLRNAPDDVPRKVDDDRLRELRWLYDRRDFAEARRDLAAWLTKWQATYPKLCGRVEAHIEETRPAIGGRASLTSTSSQPTCASVSTRRSNGALTSSGSFRTRQAVFA